MRANEDSLMMLEAMPGPVYTLAPTGELEFCNQPLLDLFGTTLEDLRDWAGRLHPDDLDRVPTKFSRCMATGEPFDDVHRARGADGGYRWIHSQARPLMHDGHIVRWYGLLTDIDPRIRPSVEEWMSGRPEGDVVSFGPSRPNARERRLERGGEIVKLSSRALEARRLRLEKGQRAGEQAIGRRIVGDSPALRHLLDAAARVAGKDITILVRGETGTGKELVASLLHAKSRRASGPLVRFNCSAIPAELAEAELFGHVKGAFTGATQAHAGFFAEANKGTLVLDEVGELPMAIQAKLLRALQEGEIQPVGSGRTEKVDVRIVACTNRDLAAETKAGRFREDLYYRLAVVELLVPPLRDRREDIPALACEFARCYAERFGMGEVRLAPALAERLSSAAWPGNVRELENTIARIIAMAGGSEVGPEAFADGGAPQHAAPETSASETTEAPPMAEKALTLREQIEALERSVIACTMTSVRGNHSEAARRLGISRNTLGERLSRYGIVAGFGSVVDLTDRKRGEDERERLRRAHAELARISRITTMGEMTASLSHELRQPIAAAMTNAKACVRFLAREHPDLGEARAAAEEMVADTTRAAEIINRVASLYRKGSPQRESVDVNEVARETLALLHAEAERHGVTLRTELAIGLPTVSADRVQLQQVFMNLMLNGIEAMQGTGGELTVRSERGEGGELVLSVSDTGVGLPPDKTDAVFEAFFTTKPQGTGMGLSISRTIVESHGGRLWAGSGTERGATFHFSLPALAG